MFDFNIVESTETGERAYYVNGIRFDRSAWRQCMEKQIEVLKAAHNFEEKHADALTKAIRLAETHMEGKATFELPQNARAFYRQVIREIRTQKNEITIAMNEIQAEIEDLTDKLED